jgi:hypothetical protein
MRNLKKHETVGYNKASFVSAVALAANPNPALYLVILLLYTYIVF